MIYKRLDFSPSKQSMKMIMECESILSPDDPLLREWHDTYVLNHKLRIASDLDIIKNKVEQNARILEVGSVPLLLTMAISRSGYHVTGCDVAPDRYESIIKKSGINIVTCDIENQNLPFNDDYFDVIVFNELFEHLRINPIFTLSEVYRVIKREGRLLLSSPNFRSLRCIKNYLLKNRTYSDAGGMYKEYEKLRTLGHMGHVKEYTTRDIIDFLGNIGFDVKEVIYRGSYTGKLSRLATRVVPSLSPFVSYLAEKPR